MLEEASLALQQLRSLTVQLAELAHRLGRVVQEVGLTAQWLQQLRQQFPLLTLRRALELGLLLQRSRQLTGQSSRVGDLRPGAEHPLELLTPERERVRSAA